MRRFLLCLVFSIFLTSCYKHGLYVHKELFDRSDLASSYVHTPDPRQENPLYGQKICIGWDLPLSEFKQQPTLQLTVRFWNHQEKIFTLPLQRERGSTSYFFENLQNEQDKKILTYRVDVINKEGKILERWKHHFWTEAIPLDQASRTK